jgi:Uma2 family endonuclease
MTGEPSKYQTADDSKAFDLSRFESYSTERAQSALRTILAAHFHAHRRNWNVVTLCRQQVYINQGKHRVCDICIVSDEAPAERVVRVPPVICIDIISEEPLALVQNRVDTYEEAGVKHIWILDPVFRTGWKASSSGLFQVRDDQMLIAGTSIGFKLSAVFEEMEEMLRPARRLSVPAALERSRERSTNPMAR